MSKGVRQHNARDRLAAERARLARRHKRTQGAIVMLGALTVLVVLVAAVVVLRSGDNSSGGYTGPLAPVTRQADGSTVMAVPGVTAPTLEVFEDFQCPACRAFEKTSGSTVAKLAAAGKARVVYRPLRLFAVEPLKSSSERAANAALCAPADKWIQLHDTLYRHQPAEGSKGFTGKDLISWAGQVGITGDTFARCVNGQEKLPEVDQMTQYALNVGKVISTPTAKLDGRDLTQSELFTAGGLEKAVHAAGSAKPRNRVGR